MLRSVECPFEETAVIELNTSAGELQQIGYTFQTTEICWAWLKIQRAEPFSFFI